VDVDTPADERKRRYFAITDLGREVAGAEATRLRGLLLEAESAGVLPARGRGR
jgi:hypothetical protein